MSKKVKVKDFLIGEGEKLAIICGPCVIESEMQALKSAEIIKKLAEKFKSLNFIYKSSYDKANRSSIESFRGPLLKEGLRILSRIKEEFNLPILSDVHGKEEAKEASPILDIIQIPAFLCRQTDLVVEAAKSQKVINVKKGQFLAPWDVENIINKITSQKNDQIILTERGVSFGYNNLIFDPRSIPVMKKFGYPICFDGTHSIQLPGGDGKSTGGQREFIPYLTKAAIAVGANCLFLESHEDPTIAKSDSKSMLSFKELEQLLESVINLYNVCNHG